MKDPTNLPAPEPACPPAEQAAAEQQQAEESFLKGAQQRGEVAPAGANADAPGVLFTEDAPGQLVRRRFSLLPDTDPAT